MLWDALARSTLTPSPKLASFPFKVLFCNLKFLVLSQLPDAQDLTTVASQPFRCRNSRVFRFAGRKRNR